MTTDIDKLIEEALDEDERKILAQIGEEPGAFAQFADVLCGQG